MSYKNNRSRRKRVVPIKLELEEEYSIERLIADVENGLSLEQIELYSSYQQMLDFVHHSGDTHYLYNSYTNSIQSHTFKRLKTELLELSGETLLLSLNNRLNFHDKLIEITRKIFNRPEAIDSENWISSKSQETLNFLPQKLGKALIHYLQCEREGLANDKNITKRCFDFFWGLLLRLSEDGHGKCSKEKQALKSYEICFENDFIRESKQFYASKIIELNKNLSSYDYLAAIGKLLNDEMELAEEYFRPTTKNKLLSSFFREFHFWSPHQLSDMEKIIDEDMFNIQKCASFKILFNILKYSESYIRNVGQKLYDYIEKKGNSIINNDQLKLDWVESVKAIIVFKCEIDLLIKSLDNFPLFKNWWDKFLRKLINGISNCAAYFACYCDWQMRIGLRPTSEVETDQILDTILNTIYYINDFDVFIHHYTWYLSKRLLEETSSSEYAEKLIIFKFKEKFGEKFASKMQIIFNDIYISEKLMEEFRELRYRGNKKGIEMDVKVLKNGCWPENPPELCLIPRELISYAECFENFYLEKYHTRRLTWTMASGTIEMSINFARNNYVCIINPYQATLLLMFNENNSFTVKEMMENSKLRETTLKANLITFFNPKCQLLKKESKGKKLEMDEKIEINENFQSKNLRINYIPKMIARSETIKKNEEIGILNDRKNMIDSIIIKVAKKSRIMKYQDIIEEVLEEMQNFKPDVSMISNQIESLIIRELLTRSENDNEVYHYVP